MTATHITSGTTVGNAVTHVTFTTWYRGIEIANRSSGDMWARVDGVDPTIAGDDCLFVPAQGFLSVDNPQRAPEPALGTAPTCDVRLITAANANYTITVGL